MNMDNEHFTVDPVLSSETVKYVLNETADYFKAYDVNSTSADSTIRHTLRPVSDWGRERKDSYGQK